MNRSALIVTSIKHCDTAQETLRVQDTVAALRRHGWAVDVLTPRASPLLLATLAADVRVFTVPRLPLLRRALLLLRGFALASKCGYHVLHGIDEGADIVRAIDRFTFKRSECVAELHHPELVGRGTVASAAAVIVSDEETLERCVAAPPKARLSVLPDPHAELAGNAFTAAEFADALDGIYTYVLRKRREEGK